ncbi:LbetaH domain-containing protein [Cupriavidus respiraculi]|uniref:Galactoside O-acetyltransferase n=1 Tax=Cupriavidus respiraculi TaxID=195930 RepID=A0ABM8WPI3_9BURK|nr:putative colanic acid biosynthesis acetyltransferase [Cupriavidus respiraculi]MBY4947155.1 putative colanic acid biosynthesis acetyltransferase [Cupriavidus respiraculi]CAG9169336.1 Galactoside O-acetyltransferase [Cupriavidus respiraculi]
MLIAQDDPSMGPSFSLGNRVQRQLWNWVWLFLFRPSPRFAHAWRSALLRLFGARLGRHVHVYPSVKIWAPWNLHIDNNVGVADGVTLYNIERIEIGEYAVISQGSHLCTGSHDYNSYNFQLVASPIVVQARAWVCAEVFVAPGVTIAEGAVVAPRSVVTRSLPTSWTVYAGTPAKPINRRKHPAAQR